MQAHKHKIRIGARSSSLALAQAEEVAGQLALSHPHVAADGVIEIVSITTSGDRQTEGLLTDFGGKGLFTKEIEEALLAGHIDIAVHSMKDMPTKLPEGLALGCLLEREDPRDTLITKLPVAEGEGLSIIAKGATVGTSSLRRMAQLLMHRPDLNIVPFRGNVPTRLKKVETGQVDATLLALAGLKRLGLNEWTRHAIAPEIILSAVAQGAIGVECREEDEALREMLRLLAHRPTEIAVTAERSLLAALDGSCRTPIAALAELSGDSLRLRGLIITPNGAVHHYMELSGAPDDAERLGREAGEELRRRGGPNFFSWSKTG